jgi:predicted nucleic acid-binding protein
VKVVANATPLIALSLINRLDLLHQLFDEVLVPPAVYEEVAIRGAGRPGASDLASASWVQVQAPEVSPTIEPMLLGLGPGELQVLLLAREMQPDWVLIDERLGRRVAQAMGLPVKGTVGLLLAAFRAGLLSKTQALEAVQQLVEQGIRISPKVITWFEAELNKP